VSYLIKIRLALACLDFMIAVKYLALDVITHVKVVSAQECTHAHIVQVKMYQLVEWSSLLMTAAALVSHSSMTMVLLTARNAIIPAIFAMVPVPQVAHNAISMDKRNTIDHLVKILNYSNVLVTTATLMSAKLNVLLVTIHATPV